VSKKVAILVFVLSAFFLPASLQSSSATISQNGYAEGELLIRFKRDVTNSRVTLAHAQLGSSIIKEYALTGWQRVRLPKGMTVEEAISHYRELDDVAGVQPNYIYRVLATPNDFRFGELYGMAKIQAPMAWDSSTGSSSVVVAVIDTGIHYTHEDLGPNMWRNPGEIAGNGIDDDNNGYVDDVFGVDLANNDSDPADDFNHGTHVAGTIGAKGNNGVGVAGVNWNVSIMAIKLHDGVGNATAADAIEAFQYVTMMKNRGVNIRVTNNSYGGAPEAAGFDQALKDAIDAAGNAGILNVFAAGNNATNNDIVPFYPASYTSPSILSVAASTATDARAGFSNFGLSSVDLAAPGQGILSTIIGTSSYGFNSGTSMATPHAAGAAALLAAHNPSLSNLSLKATLMNNVDVLSQWNGLVKTGGRLNIGRAITNPTVCNFTLSQNSQSFNVGGGVGTVDVLVATNCDWTAASNAVWISVLSGPVGSGTSTVTFSVAANPNSSSRTGTMAIAGQTYTVTQAGVAGGCSFSINPTSQSFSSAGGSGTVDVSVGAGCNWSAVSNAAFITVTSGASGSGSGMVSFSVMQNSSSSSRTGTITIAGQTFTVNQSGSAASCVSSITPLSRVFASNGGTSTVSVSASGTCNWTAQPNVAWITITANGNGPGSKLIKYKVLANPTTSARSGEIIIGGRIHTVTQMGGTCSFSISPTSQSFGAAGGAGSIQVNAGAGCAWTAASNVGFITVTGGASGSGSGIVNFSVDANGSASPRAGTITVAGQTFTVNQSGATGGCTYSINPTSQSFSSAGGSGTVDVSVGAGCNWSAVSNAAFITVTSGASGSGSGMVSFSVMGNSSSSSRTGTITIAGQTFTVSQSGVASCSFTVSPLSVSYKKAGGSGTVSVSTGAGCNWTAVSNVSWITITSAGGASGSGAVSYTISVNNTASTRTGTMTIAGKTVTIKQASF